MTKPWSLSSRISGKILQSGWRLYGIRFKSTRNYHMNPTHSESMRIGVHLGRLPVRGDILKEYRKQKNVNGPKA